MLNAAQVAQNIANRKLNYSLSQELYCDDGVYRADLEQIWYKEWLFVIPSAQLTKAGSYATLQVGAYPVVVVKGADGMIRAFHNVCRHRGQKLCAKTEGSAPKIVCPYHQWTFDLDGKLLYARDMQEGFDPAAHGLKKVHCADLGGVVYQAAEEPNPRRGLRNVIPPLCGGGGQTMRGTDRISGSLFSYVDIEDRIPARHPLRQVKRIVDDALASLDAEFARLYAAEGRPSIAPERLMRASLIQILFSVRSERQLMEQMQYNLLFRWFVGLGVDDAVWVPTVFTKNRDRLLTTEMSRKFLAAILAHRDVAPLLSDEHFSVDGTLIKAWASMKSFQPKPTVAPPDDGAPDGPPATATGAGAEQPAPQDPQTTEQADPEPAAETAPMPKPARRDRNADVDFRGERRSNATHASTTDPDARLFRKSRGAGAILCFMGHTLMENRNGLIVQAELTHADGHSERRAALDMIHRHSPGSTRRLTLGADKGYDSADFVAELRQACVTPHVAQKGRGSAIDGRTTRHAGYALSQQRRKKIEEPFGWAKTVGGMAQTVLRGLERVRARFTLTMAASNLARLPKLLAA